MIGQMVLRGGSIATSPDHARLTYRNFYRPEQRWMFSGIRLARDLKDPSNTGGWATLSCEFAADMIAGLSTPTKSPPARYLYDACGSALFEEICRTPEYYPTRAETALLREFAHEIAAEIPDDATLVEFGSGASEKTRAILDLAPQVAFYVPIDICKDALDAAAATVSERYPAITTTAVAGEFTDTIRLPSDTLGHAKFGFFPGSTMGNLARDQAIPFSAFGAGATWQRCRLVDRSRSHQGRVHACCRL